MRMPAARPEKPNIGHKREGHSSIVILDRWLSNVHRSCLLPIFLQYFGQILIESMIVWQSWGNAQRPWRPSSRQILPWLVLWRYAPSGEYRHLFCYEKPWILPHLVWCHRPNLNLPCWWAILWTASDSTQRLLISSMALISLEITITNCQVLHSL